MENINLGTSKKSEYKKESYWQQNDYSENEEVNLKNLFFS